MALTPEEINIHRWKIRWHEVEAERASLRLHHATQDLRDAEHAIDNEKAILRLEGVDI